MKIHLHDKGKDNHFKIWHAVEENMLIYSYSDGGSIVSSERNYPIEHGALCFVGEGRYHYTMPEPPESYDRTKLFFSTETLRKVLELISDGRRFSHFAQGSLVYARLPEAAREEAEALFLSVAKEKGDVYCEANAVACLIKLLTLADKYSTESAIGQSGVLERAIEYINSNIFRDVDIDEICLAVHISKYHFCRRFKASMGMTVMEYILKTRIILAKNMLDKETVSVTEVSESCGFSSVSYFCRVFKQEIGISPLKYKKRTK